MARLGTGESFRGRRRWDTVGAKPEGEFGGVFLHVLWPELPTETFPQEPFPGLRQGPRYEAHKRLMRGLCV